jgi:hypothetical protein
MFTVLILAPPQPRKVINNIVYSLETLVPETILVEEQGNRDEDIAVENRDKTKEKKDLSVKPSTRNVK